MHGQKAQFDKKTLKSKVSRLLQKFNEHCELCIKRSHAKKPQLTVREYLEAELTEYEFHKVCKDTFFYIADSSLAEAVLDEKVPIEVIIERDLIAQHSQKDDKPRLILNPPKLLTEARSQTRICHHSHTEHHSEIERPKLPSIKHSFDDGLRSRLEKIQELQQQRIQKIQDRYFKRMTSPKPKPKKVPLAHKSHSPVSKSTEAFKRFNEAYISIDSELRQSKKNLILHGNRSEMLSSKKYSKIL
jgi:hypothetical protein